ncbi:hypothetical protein CDD81_8071 [Ophiocordyceps australis]|uniref:Uncharacterized protein n=1 Tax=Ophiocordyceps australis TaxID=1399860 RepID=A0A2C5Y2M2_9HYPO|nr:hypothetical protein CDD81_8071 [Ophiocordyceps australis]
MPDQGNGSSRLNHCIDYGNTLSAYHGTGLGLGLWANTGTHMYPLPAVATGNCTATLAATDLSKCRLPDWWQTVERGMFETDRQICLCVRLAMSRCHADRANGLHLSTERQHAQRYLDNGERNHALPRLRAYASTRPHVIVRLGISAPAASAPRTSPWAASRLLLPCSLH